MKRLGSTAIAILLLIAGIVGACAPAPFASPAAGEPTPTAAETAATPIVPTASTETVVILHTNDFHGAVEPAIQGSTQSGGLVNLAGLIDQARAENPNHTLVLDAGDTFQGTYVSNSTQGEVVMAAMNAVGYDGWTLGNHEFDWGQEVLQARIAQAQFPALAANLLDGSTGEIWEGVEPFVIVEAGAAKVAILGLTYPDTPTINKPQNVAGLDFQEATGTVRRYLPELEEQADLIVVLSHLGFDGDQALARAVDGIDVIVGGHSHLFLEQPREVNSTLIVQAGAKGQVLGRLELTLDLGTGQVTGYNRRGMLLPVDGSGAGVHQEVQTLVDAALQQAAETMDQPIGEMARALEPQRAGEFALGNLVTDAMLAADLSDGSTPDIAMHNSGGIRAGLPWGSVTYGQVYAVLPFDNQLIALDLTGEQVLRILEHSVADRAGNMQVAGLAFRFAMAKPVGQRVKEVTVGGEPLDSARVYRVVTIDYLAAGGDGQETFLEGENPTYGDGEVWVLAEYIRVHSPVESRVEGRMVGR
jgi:2',3'-cyclic-nucleotide 2'-phosphodiesterase (5'-nucleotidase family)